MANARNQRGLGRGLSALLADTDINTSEEQTPPKPTDTLPLEFLHPNPDQPRKRFDKEEMEELTQSISEKGIIQPILVRKTGEDHYQIIAGERRWRAAGMARLHTVPVIVRDYTDNEVAEIALIENIQRANLNPIEEAQGYEELIARGNTQEEVAKATGKSRSHIANMQRILRLQSEVRDYIADGRLSFGHAKVLAASENQLEDAKWVVANSASVRELERRIEKAKRGEVDKPRPQAQKDADTVQLERELHANLGMGIKIDHKKDGQGKLVISYKDLDQLDRLCQMLGQ